jgi:hypothetical protein
MQAGLVGCSAVRSEARSKKGSLTLVRSQKKCLFSWTAVFRLLASGFYQAMILSTTTVLSSFCSASPQNS